MEVSNRNSEDDFFKDFSEVFKTYQNGVKYLFDEADKKVSSRIANKALKKAYNSKAAKVTRALLAAGTCMAAFPVAKAVMFSAGPADSLPEKSLATLGGGLTVACIAGTVVSLSYAGQELHDTKMGRAFVHGCKNGMNKMDNFVKSKFIPFVKTASKKIEQEAKNYFGKEGMDVYVARGNGKSGVKYHGTILDDKRTIRKPLPYLRDIFVRNGRLR